MTDGAKHPPMCSFGTFEGNLYQSAPEVMHTAAKLAIKAGYRHFDCAEMYVSTEPVGRALKEAFQTIPREEFWITTKLSGVPAGDYAEVRRRLTDQLALLGVEAADLLLCHWPGPADLDLAGDPADADRSALLSWFSQNIASGWANVQRLKAEGLADRIGVSNFGPEALRAVLALGGEPPFANEVFCDLAHPVPTDLLALQRSHGVRLFAYGCLRGLSAWRAAAPEAVAHLTAVADVLRVDEAQAALLAIVITGLADVVVSSSTQQTHVENNFATEQLAEQFRLVSFAD
eukprot:EG_transcript_22223